MVAPLIRWIERSPYLHEARVVLPNGHDVFTSYVAASPGQSAWRGDVGSNFAPVGMGPRQEMQRVVEQRAREILG